MENIDWQEIYQGFVGFLLLNPEQCIDMQSRPEDLPPEYGVIYDHIRSLGEDTSVVRLVEAIGEGWSFSVNLGQFCRSLADVGSFVLPSALQGYDQAIYEKARKESLVWMAQRLAGNVEKYSLQDITEMLTGCIASNNSHNQIIPCTDLQDKIISGLEMPLESISSGLEGLDRILGGGVYPGKLIALCGAEKAGKTTFGHTLSFSLETKHLYVAMEMGSQEIEQRNMARDLGVNSLKFLEDRDQVKTIIKNTLPRNNVYYLDAPGINLDELLMSFTVARKRYGVTGAIVDYWQLIRPPGNNSTEEAGLRHIAQTLADYTRKHNFWLVVLAQMNKQGELFGGNGLKKACDILFMLERCEDGVNPNGRWIRNEASRYTPQMDMGSPKMPGLILRKDKGPYFEEYKY